MNQAKLSRYLNLWLVMLLLILLTLCFLSARPWLMEKLKEEKTSQQQLEDAIGMFSYVKNQSTSVHSGRPLLLAPMTAEGEEFDVEPYDGKAVVLRIDGSVKQLRIDKKSGKAMVEGGRTLFDGGEDSVWGVHGFHPEWLVHPKR